jgi:hypothetical protein
MMSFCRCSPLCFFARFLERAIPDQDERKFTRELFDQGNGCIDKGFLVLSFKKKPPPLPTTNLFSSCAASLAPLLYAGAWFFRS